jgi:hypothetical protein
MPSRRASRSAEGVQGIGWMIGCEGAQLRLHVSMDSGPTTTSLALMPVQRALQLLVQGGLGRSWP